MPAIVQPRRRNICKTAFVSLLLTAFFAYTYFIRDPLGPPNPTFRGRTMGTTYEMKAVGSRKVQSELDAISSEIDHTLFELNRQMSTYIDDSEISMFNTSTATNPYPISADFAKVTEQAIALSHATTGAFDPTLAPLINLWGFGNEAHPHSLPSSNDVNKALARCNVEHIQLSPGPSWYIIGRATSGAAIVNQRRHPRGSSGSSMAAPNNGIAGGIPSGIVVVVATFQPTGRG